MLLVLKRLQSEWPSWMVIAFIALLPFGRAPELPLLILAFSLPFLLRNPEHRARARRVAIYLVPLFLCFWLPMVLSSSQVMDGARTNISATPQHRTAKRDLGDICHPSATGKAIRIIVVF